MAGNYPDVPSWRMAWDRDGTQAYLIRAIYNDIIPVASADMITLNSENELFVTFNVQDSAAGNKLMLWFPEKRDVDGFFINATGDGQESPQQVSVEVSTDTTNGIDGTWTQIKAAYMTPQSVLPTYRTNIQSSTALGVRAIRFVWAQTTSFGHVRSKAFHVYGEPIPGANPNRLSLWHPTLDQRITPAHFDWGDVPRSSSADKQFRVKNLSSTLTANSIRVAQEALADAASGNPSVPGQHTLSVDGTTFLAQVNVGALAPGALSGVVTLRRNTPSNAQLGVWAHRVFAEAGSWS